MRERRKNASGKSATSKGREGGKKKGYLFF